MSSKATKRSFIWDIPFDEFKKIVQHNFSINAIVMHYYKHPGNGRTIKARIKKENIDTSHLTGQSWAKGMKLDHCSRPKHTLNEILVKNSTYSNRQSLKRRLIRVGRLKDECQLCGIGSVWNDKPIVLQVDHINGIHNDNRIENLRVLCPNCHSQTDTFCTKMPSIPKTNIVHRPVKKRYATLKFQNTCVDCLCDIQMKNKRCNKCASIINGLNCRRVERPPVEQLLKEIKNLGYTGTGKKYGVSDNAIRKWVK